MNLPENVANALSTFVEAAKAALGENLRSAVLFGSAAEGKMRATSDVNLLLILRELDRTQIDALREPLRLARAAIDLEVMFVLERELGAAAEAFANKWEDIRRRHVVLHGDDLVSRLTISREALIRRVQQVLLNQTLRLREAYAERSLREEQAAMAIAEAAAPLRTAAAAILEIEGRPAADPKSALEAIVRESADDDFASLLPHFSEAREKRLMAPGTAPAVLFGISRLAGWLYDRAARLG